MQEQPKIDWYRTPIDKEKLRELTRRENFRPLLHILTQILFSVATGAGVIFAWKYLPWPFMVLAIYLHATFIHFLTHNAAFHELSHRSPFKTRWLNEFFLRLVTFFSWDSFVLYRQSHLAMHHPYTVYKGIDHEVVLPSVIRPIDIFFAFTVPLYSFQNVSGIFDLLNNKMAHCFGRFAGEKEAGLFPEDKPELRSRLFNWDRFVVIGHLVLASAFLYFGLWPMLFVVTFPRFIAPWLSLMCNYTQHVGLKPSVPDFRVCCRSMHLGRFLSFFYWNMNYHTEHHMYAAVPYYNLPKLHEAVKHDMPEVKKGLLNNWRHIWPTVVRQRTEPDYCYIPDLPSPSPAL